MCFKLEVHTINKMNIIFVWRKFNFEYVKSYINIETLLIISSM